MRRVAARHHANTYGFAIFIGALIGILVLVTAGIKVFLLFQHSSFDAGHQFSLEIQEGNQTRFVVFNPEDMSIHALLVRGYLRNPLLTLGVPVDGSMVSSSDISSLSTLGNDLLFKRKSFHVSTTIIDGIRFFIFIHTQDSEKEMSREMTLSQAPGQDSTLTQLFTDETIYKEGESIAIVNGTGMSGLGNKISQLFTHMGANVVSVTTADTPSPVSYVGYIGNMSYTTARVSHVLSLPIRHLSPSGISDITILLGTDFTLAK